MAKPVKMFSNLSLGMPQPVSLTLISTNPSFCAADGKITKIEFGRDYKNCHLDFAPHVDNKKGELVLRFTFISCVQFMFSVLEAIVSLLSNPVGH